MFDFFKRLRFGKQYGYEILFKGQQKRTTGKVGVLIAEMGLPEDYEFPFYSHFMEHVFSYVLPPFIKPIVLADRGVALIDPEHPLARQVFQPGQLIDSAGSFTNQSGKPYVECNVQWVSANLKNPWDHGYFLYTGDGPNGFPDVCDKVGAKIIGWYYGRLIPENKVPWRSQLRKVYEEAISELGRRFPGTEFCNAHYMDMGSIHQAVEELLYAGCQTIVYQNINCPVYSDFDDFGYVLPLLHPLVSNRARLIMADQIGNQAPMREAYLQILRDQLMEIPPTSSVLVILSCHGHPFKKETQDNHAYLYRQLLEKDMQQLMSSWRGKWDVVWTFDEYADDYWDKSRKKVETYSAYRRAIMEGNDFAIELPTEFPAENTDLMIFHAMKKFRAFSDYDCYQPIPYPDWEKPLLRTYHEGKTTGICAGTPVGPYRKYVVQAVVGSLSEVLTR